LKKYGDVIRSTFYVIRITWDWGSLGYSVIRSFVNLSDGRQV
jgi:hypothetical protein